MNIEFLRGRVMEDAITIVVKLQSDRFPTDGDSKKIGKHNVAFRCSLASP